MNDQVSMLDEAELDEVTGGLFGSLFARWRGQQSMQPASSLSGLAGSVLQAYGEALGPLARF
jgi:hypothetical protein